MPDPTIGIQYADRRHQAQTAVAGMWLFLGTEVLFFGALILTYFVYRNLYPQAFAAAVGRTNLVIGSINTILLLTSSVTFTAGLAAIAKGNRRRLMIFCLATIALGLGFLTLKGFEYADDIRQNLVPGSAFPVSGPEGAHMQLFFLFYWIATPLHAIHMIIGIGLILNLLRLLRTGALSATYYTPVEVTALYWSFVDMVWVFLYPLLYLVDRLPLGHFDLPIVLAVAAMMAMLIATRFMKLGDALPIARIFAIGSLFWLAVMFSLIGADYLSRVTYPTGF